MSNEPSVLTHSYSDLGGYEPFGETGTMLPPSPEMMEDLQYVPEAETLASLLHDHDPADADDGAEYATYAEPTASELEASPASLNEDDELPPYSIYARYFQTDKPVKYPRLKCGHKYRNEFEPNHRNCEQCWFAHFQVHGELTQAVEEAYQKGGAQLINKLKGPKFLDNFLKFMSTVAVIKAQQEAVKNLPQESVVYSEAKETDASITEPSSDQPIGEDPWESPAYIGGGSVAD